MIQNIKDVKRPIEIDEYFLVPCITTMDEDLIPNITPVLYLKHNDVENGQKEYHYHIDTRFVKQGGVISKDADRSTRYRFLNIGRPNEKVHGKIEYFVLPVIDERFEYSTPINFIKKSKLKHKCIHKGKCPHRGYDLSQVKPVNGVITCPLHSLQFNAKTKKLIK